MGQIQTAFGRQTRAEKLEQLETGIREKEKEKQNNGRNQAVVTGYVNKGAIGTFLLTGILYLFTLVPELMVMVVPIVYLLVRFFISWRYNSKVKNHHHELYNMREEKRMLLEDVKKNETFVVAKELLQQYGHPEDHWISSSPRNDSPDNSDKKSDDDVNKNMSSPNSVSR